MSDDVSFEEATRELGTTEAALRDMVECGELRAFRDGGQMRFRREDVQHLKLGRSESALGEALRDVRVGAEVDRLKRLHQLLLRSARLLEAGEMLAVLAERLESEGHADAAHACWQELSSHPQLGWCGLAMLDRGGASERARAEALLDHLRARYADVAVQAMVAEIESASRPGDAGRSDGTILDLDSGDIAPPEETAAPSIDFGDANAEGSAVEEAGSETGETTGITEEMVFEDSDVLRVEPSEDGGGELSLTQADESSETGSVAEAMEVEDPPREDKKAAPPIKHVPSPATSRRGGPPKPPRAAPPVQPSPSPVRRAKSSDLAVVLWVLVGLVGACGIIWLVSRLLS